MFRSNASRLDFTPKSGMEVICFGYVTVFTRDTQLQLYVEEMVPSGEGALYQALEELKQKLLKEGLFKEEHKKRIPLFPLTVGVVTSPTGAVLKDIIHVARRRFQAVDIVLAPASVQGVEAPLEIVQAIELLNQWGKADVIIVARGGGSLEELWAFNAEEVVRAIFNSHLPVISAVGHETDYTLADFVADKRAPTPSAAAEIAVPLKIELISRLRQYENRIKRSLLRDFEYKKRRFDSLASRAVLQKPLRLIDQKRQELSELARRLDQGVNVILTAKKNEVEKLRSSLKTLDPKAVLSRGYALLTDEKGKIIKRAEDTAEGERIEARLSRGLLFCQVLEKRE
jgi:exodeoxyribonuclease VII large subunit